MTKTEEIIDLLLKVKESRKEEEKVFFIKKIQNLAWEGSSNTTEEVEDLLLDLAYTLDFYEPKEKWRKESKNYYGEQKLCKKINDFIKKIEVLKKHKSEMLPAHPSNKTTVNRQ